MMDAVRFLDDSDDGLEGIAIPFDGPFDGKDLHKTRFSASTDYAFDWFPVRPLLYNHGLDEDAGLSVVGQVRAWDIRTDIGVWVQMQLDKGSQFFDGIRELVRAKKLFLSSGAMGHLVDEDAATGEVRRWPWVELSLTPTPSNYYATVDFGTARAHFRCAGLDLPDAMEGAGIGAPQAQTPPPVATRADDGAADPPAQAADDRSYEDLISDLRDLLNPASPFSQAGYTSIMATYPDHVLCSRWDGYGDGDADEPTYWSVAYYVGPGGEPTLGAATQMEQAYVPVASSRSAIGPLTLDAHQLTLHAGALAQRTQDLSDRRIREGRVLSAHNRQLLTDAHARMGEAHGALGDLLDATGRQADDAARAAQWGDPAFRRQQFALLDLFASTVK